MASAAELACSGERRQVPLSHMGLQGAEVEGPEAEVEGPEDEAEGPEAEAEGPEAEVVGQMGEVPSGSSLHGQSAAGAVGLLMAYWGLAT